MQRRSSIPQTHTDTHLLGPGLDLGGEVGLAAALGVRAATEQVWVHALAKGGERVERGLQALAVDEETSKSTSLCEEPGAWGGPFVNSG